MIRLGRRPLLLSYHIGKSSHSTAGRCLFPYVGGRGLCPFARGQFRRGLASGALRGCLASCLSHSDGRMPERHRFAVSERSRVDLMGQDKQKSR